MPPSVAKSLSAGIEEEQPFICALTSFVLAGKWRFRCVSEFGKMGVYALENGVPVFPRALRLCCPAVGLVSGTRSRREWLLQSSRLAAGLSVAL